MPRITSFGGAISDAKRETGGNGGARRDRTDDLLLAKQALSQLSYGPCLSSSPYWTERKDGRARPRITSGAALAAAS